MSLSIEVIVSTYRNSVALDASLASLKLQSIREFDMCVAEDAQESETADIVFRYSARHVSQPDNGFRKNTILNDAIRSSQADYLIFIDGDCLAHPNFIARHVACAHRDRYLSGGVVRLSQSATKAITLPAVTSGDVWQRDWLKKHGLWQKIGHRLKLMPNNVGPVLDRASLARKRWLGCNASTFRENLITVNGFDEALVYGGEDKELGVRLENAGVRPYSIRYSAPILHLEHGRPYVKERKNPVNKQLIVQRKRMGTTWTPNGLTQTSLES